MRTLLAVTPAPGTMVPTMADESPANAPAKRRRLVLWVTASILLPLGLYLSAYYYYFYLNGDLWADYAITREEVVEERYRVSRLFPTADPDYWGWTLFAPLRYIDPSTHTTQVVTPDHERYVIITNLLDYCDHLDLEPTTITGIYRPWAKERQLWFEIDTPEIYYIIAYLDGKLVIVEQFDN